MSGAALQFSFNLAISRLVSFSFHYFSRLLAISRYFSLILALFLQTFGSRKWNESNPNALAAFRGIPIRAPVQARGMAKVAP